MRTQEKRITVRMTQQQYDHLQQKMERAKMKQNAFVLQCIAENPINVIEEMPAIFRELRAIGNNINQMTRAINSGAIANQPVIEEVQKGVNELWQLLRQLKEGERSSKR
jgi:uncharacterized protein (DUF1778 family)